jgi:hypothetical protein
MKDKIFVTDAARIIVTEPITPCSCSERNCHGDGECEGMAREGFHKCPECEKVAAKSIEQTQQDLNRNNNQPQ